MTKTLNHHQKNRPQKGSNISLVWTKNCKTEEEKEKLETLLRNNSTLINRLQEIIEEKVLEIRDKEVNENAYDSPSWSHKQAHINGFIAGMKYVTDLLKFMPK
jgi:hypothetical protein